MAADQQSARPIDMSNGDGETEHGSSSTSALWREPLLWLTLGLSLFAVAPFMQPGYFWGANDARHHVYFLFEFDRLVQDGIWWPRWSPDFAFGYGYPFFNIYGPFSHFVAELFLRLGRLDYTAAVETVFGLSVIGSAAAMYAYIRSWMGSQAALISALVYVFIPYHLLNLYVRANLAESMAFVWLPLCLWAARQCVLRPGLGWAILLAISYAGLMLTSNLVIVLFTPLLALYLVVLVLVYGASARHSPWSVRIRGWIRTALLPGLGLVAGIGFSAIFWLPMAAERQYVRVDQWFDGRYDFSGNFVYPFQLFSPQWGFGTSIAGPDDRIGFQIGVAALIFAVMGVILAWQRIGRERWEVLSFATAAVVALFAGLTWGSPLWELPIVGTILGFAQFPWRWFGITMLCVSILSGLIFHPAIYRSNRELSLPLFVAVAVVMLSSYPYLRVEVSEPVEGPVSLAGLMYFQQSSDEMTGSTAWVKEIPTWSPMADYYISQDSQDSESIQPVSTKVDYNDETYPVDYKSFGLGSVAHNTVMEEVYFFNEREVETRIVFNHFYYPGWRAYLLDGEHGEPLQELPIIPEEEGTLGRMTVPLPQGEGYVLLSYTDTSPRTVGRTISLITLVVIILLVAVRLIHRWRTQDAE